MSLTRDVNATGIHKNFIGIYIVSLEKEWKISSKLNLSSIFWILTKECKFMALLKQTIMKFVSITKGKKEKKIIYYYSN